jgi:hypothetical protein
LGKPVDASNSVGSTADSTFGSSTSSNASTAPEKKNSDFFTLISRINIAEICETFAIFFSGEYIPEKSESLFELFFFRFSLSVACISLVMVHIEIFEDLVKQFSKSEIETVVSGLHISPENATKPETSKIESGESFEKIRLNTISNMEVKRRKMKEEDIRRRKRMEDLHLQRIDEECRWEEKRLKYEEEDEDSETTKYWERRNQGLPMEMMDKRTMDKKRKENERLEEKRRELFFQKLGKPFKITYTLRKEIIGSKFFEGMDASFLMFEDFANECIDYDRLSEFYDTFLDSYNNSNSHGCTLSVDEFLLIKKSSFEFLCLLIRYTYPSRYLNNEEMEIQKILKKHNSDF